MKKFSIIILLSLLLSFIPPAAVQAVDEPTLEAVLCWDNATGTYIACENEDPLTDTIKITGTYSYRVGYPNPNGFKWNVSSKINCTGLNCAGNYNIYYKVSFNYWINEQWVVGDKYIKLILADFRDGLDYWSEEFYMFCGTGGGWGSAATECGSIFYGVLNQADMDPKSPPDNNEHAMLQLENTGSGSLAELYVTYTIEMSLTPFDDCLDGWAPMGDGVTKSIPVTSQVGNSAPVTPSQTYKVEIFNGPWNDGSTDRFDSAYSTDGTNYTAVSLLESDCKSLDETGYYSFLITVAAGVDEIYIRVNDTVGNFGNNTGSLSFRITMVYIYVNCEGQFSYDPQGEQIAAGEVAATSTGVKAADLTIASWYVFVTTAGHWHNGAGPTELFGVSARNSAGAYQSLGAYEQSNCQSWAGNYVTVYFQADQADLYLRVSDAGGVFSDNTGSVSYAIYAATYTRFPDLCESIYQIGDLVETKYVAGNMINGITLDTKGAIKMEDVTGGGDAPVVSKWYVLDVIGGPWTKAGVPSYSAQFSNDDPASWVGLEIHPDVACAVQLDMMGRYRIYFQAAKDKTYKFRVDDTNFIGNTGTLGYTLYEVASTDTYDPVDIGIDTCDTYYTQGAQIWEATLSSTNQDGYVLSGYTNGDMISISTFNGPWDDGSGNRWDIALSGDDGSTWYSIWEYPGVSCAQSADGDHMTVYLTAQFGKTYRVRINDDAGLFANNTGTMLVTAYGSTHTIDPWYSCADDYQMRTINLNGSWGDFFQLPDFMSGVFDDNLYRFPIPQTLENGVQIGTPVLGVLQTGKTYAIKIVNGPWYDVPSTDERMDAALSSDNGTNWEEIAPGMGECTVQNDAGSIMTFFTIASGEKYRVRVNDDGSLIDFAYNLGNLEYQLYAAQDDSTIYDDNDGGGVIPDWVLSCNQQCVRPSSILDVSAWLEYGRCQISYFLSWCPEHTAALGYVNSIFEDREPFGSIIEIANLIPYTQSEINAYEWDTSDVPNFDTLALGGDGVGMINPLGFANGLSQSSPWNGGEIKFEQPALGGGESLKTCSSNLTAIIGGPSSKLPSGYCFVLNVTKLYGVHLTILALEAIGCVLYLFEYINSRWMTKLGY